MSVQWSQIRFFKESEFRSPDAPGSGDKMDETFVKMLDELRARCGIPLMISSGYRTEAHNKKVGGVDSSSHTSGHAADIKCRSSVTRAKILKVAYAMGFRRIGVASTFVHLDNSPDLPQDVTWVY